jgi:hypothetical protein
MARYRLARFADLFEVTATCVPANESDPVTGNEQRWRVI